MKLSKKDVIDFSSIAGFVFGVAGVFLTIYPKDGVQNSGLLTIIIDFAAACTVGLVILAIFTTINYFRRIRRYKIATKYRAPRRSMMTVDTSPGGQSLVPLHDNLLLRLLRRYHIGTRYLNRYVPQPLTQAEIDVVTQNKNCLHYNAIQCLNRRPFGANEPPVESTGFWLSSWLGADGQDLVQNVIVPEGVHNVAGRIPVLKHDFFEPTWEIFALQLDFKHVYNNHSCWWAALHGLNGRYSLGRWDKEVVNVDLARNLKFFAKAINVCQSPKLGKDGEQVENGNDIHDLLIYIRLEDKQRNPSNGSVVRISNYWKPYEIPIGKFFTSPELSFDMHRYADENTTVDKGKVFDPENVMQIVVGNTSKMPSQEGRIVLYNIRFE